jgi:hypothetical protein
MARKQLRIKPLAYMYSLDQAPLNASPLTAQWPSMNVMVSSNRITRRWDSETFRTFDDTETLQAIPIFRTAAGTQYTLVLTDTDLVKIMGGSGETYQYLTDTYTTGAVSGVASDVITGNAAANWDTDAPDLNAGDKFIINTDHTAAGEPDSAWGTIESVDTDTQITLTAAYAGAATSGAYKIRKVYSCPSNERWQFVSVAGKFCFGNGNVYMQYWDGALTYATNLNTTYCNQVRYCAAYANRLVIADMYDADAVKRNPWRVRWSKEGDPTNWTDTTAGFNDFIDSAEPIVGLGVSGDNILVFKNTSYYIGVRTGQASSPISFPSHKPGIGVYAPYSIVHAGGSVAWMGLDDFYFFNGADAEPIGGPIRKKFFDLVSDDEAKAVFGINNVRYNEVLWVANTSVGQYVFSYNWKEKSWSTYKFDANLTGLGGAGV